VPRVSADPKAAAIALHRFGLGPRQGSIAAIASDPRGALIAELQLPTGAHTSVAGLQSSGAIARVLFGPLPQATSMQPRPKVGMRNVMPPPSSGSMAGSTMARTDAPAPKPARSPVGQLMYDEAHARVSAAVGAKIGFVERLVAFWSNHFCVSTDKVGPMAGAYEREAIRPHVLGRFADMLQAAESHPAMLIYLDNTGSTGPASEDAADDAGLNENLGREILELHTVGVRTGYTQDDVTRLAKVITGWTILPPDSDRRRGGEFYFNPSMHEPGPQVVMGKRYPDTGVRQGRAVLADLARHPATAQHIAFKLARHFVADQPPLALVEHLAARFRDTDGNLKEVAQTLVTALEAWEDARAKLKPPWEWVIGSLRVTGVEPVTDGVLSALRTLGQALWTPPAPNGFPDLEADWIEGLPQRLDIASEFAAATADRGNPIAMIDVTLGPLASDQTRQTVARAGSRQDALALLLLAPEFQRR
jgi:uncharacterized protein (DUF1800 family)